MSPTSPEHRLSRFVVELDFAQLPDGVVETVTKAFIDTVGVTLAGAENGQCVSLPQEADLETADSVFALGPVEGEAPEEAALRLGTAAHALDYDDLSWALAGHPSVTLVPPLLALAEDADADGRDLITAYVAGFEVECAIADPILPAHYETGWHATSTFGTFGAVAAASNLLGLDYSTTKQALNIAASMPSGLKRNFGSMTKPLHAGLCSRSGVTAALHARGGYTAGSTAISGDGGFWDLYGSDQRGPFNIGDSWTLETEGIHLKAYPCCYFTHTSIAAAQELTRGGLDNDEIKRIDVIASGGAADALIYPEPSTELEAKFSMEHAVACALQRDRVGLEAFVDSAIQDQRIKQLGNLVEFTVDEDLEYTSHQATVQIRDQETVHEKRMENPPGTHTNPLSENELREKFEECAGQALPSDQVDRVYDALASLRSISDMATVMEGA